MNMNPCHVAILFTQNTEGLAIQSTIGRLQNALAPENNYKQFIGEVNYIDYKRIHPFDDMFFRFIQRKAFNTSVRCVHVLMAESNITKR
jgi:hypothetical protein